MEFEIVYQSKNVTLKCLKELNCPLLEFNGLINPEDYKLVMEKVYKLILQKKMSFWITDLTNTDVILPENQNWTNQYFLPKVLKTTRINKMAILLGNDTFSHPVMHKIREETESANLPIRYMNNFDDIKNWFKDKEKAF